VRSQFGQSTRELRPIAGVNKDLEDVEGLGAMTTVCCHSKRLCRCVERPSLQDRPLDQRRTKASAVPKQGVHVGGGRAVAPDLIDRPAAADRSHDMVEVVFVDGDDGAVGECARRRELRQRRVARFRVVERLLEDTGEGGRDRILSIDPLLFGDLPVDPPLARRQIASRGAAFRSAARPPGAATGPRRERSPA
jgi:hypothetical protein